MSDNESIRRIFFGQLATHHPQLSPRSDLTSALERTTH